MLINLQTIWNRKSVSAIKSELHKQHVTDVQNQKLKTRIRSKTNLDSKLAAIMLIEAFGPSDSKNFHKIIGDFPGAHESLRRSGLEDLRLLREPNFLGQAYLGFLDKESSTFRSGRKKLPEVVEGIHTWQVNLTNSFSLVFSLFVLDDEKTSFSKLCANEFEDTLTKIEVISKGKIARHLVKLPWWRPIEYSTKKHIKRAELMHAEEIDGELQRIARQCQVWFRQQLDGYFNASNKNFNPYIPFIYAKNQTFDLERFENLLRSPSGGMQGSWACKSEQLTLIINHLVPPNSRVAVVLEIPEFGHHTAKNLDLIRSHEDVSKIDRLINEMSWITADFIIRDMTRKISHIRDTQRTNWLQTNLGFGQKRFGKFLRNDALDINMIAQEIENVCLTNLAKSSSKTTRFSREFREGNSNEVRDFLIFGYQFLIKAAKDVQVSLTVLLGAMQSKSQFVLTRSNTHLQIIILLVTIIALFS